MYPPQQPLPAPPPAKKSVWARWWMIIIYVVVGLLFVSCLAGLLGGGDAEEPGTEESTDTQAEEPAGDQSEESAGVEADPEASEPDYFAEAYPVFDPVERSGDSDSVIDLPEGIGQAMVTATYEGSGNFSVSALDANNQSTGDLLVNTIGSYEGVTALGMFDIAGDPVRLEVTADGAWTITIAPLSSAPGLPESGSGDGVFRYEGDAATWSVTHDGESNFALSFYTDADFEMPLLVNEIGSYEGESAVGAGLGLVTVNADGSWTITAK
jgi:hypothetical protein